MKSSTITDSPAIGIDLGTLYSCVGVWIDSENQVEIIPNDQGNRTTPSYAAFTDQETLIGNAAFNQIASNPINTIYGVKRFIGKKYSNYSVQNDLKLWPFKVDKGPNNKPMVAVTVKGEIRRFSAEEISSMVLKKLKESAEIFLNRPIKDAVITVPAFFNSSQREATEEAGKLAGLNVLRIINEPTAAAIAYGLTSEEKGERNVLIFDLGGGTFDVSVLNIDGGLFEVKSTAGDNHLGGEDFTNKLVEFCAADFEQKSGHDIINNSRALRRLRAQCEKAKRILSSASHTTIEVDSLSEAVDYVCVITQAKFEEICHPLFQRTISLVEKALQDSNITKDNISDIVLVGGATRTPKISQMLTQFFNGKEPNKNLNPEEVVACGAAIKAAIIAGQMNKSAKDISVIDLTESSKGLDNADEEETDKTEGKNEEKIEELGIQRRNVVKAELENYCHTVHNVLEDEILKKKFTESEKEELEKTCDGILMWIEVHKEAEEEDYVEKLKEIRGKYNLILSRGDEDERKKETANREYNEGPVTTYISAYQETQGQTSVP